MNKQSAGILAYRRLNGIEFFLVHPGGPVWANRDEGAWSIPKGEFEDEDALSAARREFEEEVGRAIDGEFMPLTPVVQKAGKKVFAFAVEADIDADSIKSNTFEMEWPRKSGKYRRFPEVDSAAWFDLASATRKINSGQRPLLEELVEKLGIRGSAQERQ